MPSWIDFKELREKLRFADVLAHYGVEVNADRAQQLGFCPLPTHNGDKKLRSFSVNLERSIFHCFGCGAKGNILDFAALMEKKNPKDGREVKAVAVMLREKFCSDAQARPAAKESKPEPDEKPPELLLGPEVVVNGTLDFELKQLDPEHPYLQKRGFTPETIAYFGLGYCSRGLLSGRIAIPLHNSDRKLIGYAGRIVDDAKINNENPRYLFPTRREREGKVLEFRRSLFLYNASRIKVPCDRLIVVEGFPAVWWLHQHGYSSVVATMGAECSNEQAILIVAAVKPDGHVVVMPDGNEAGEKLAHAVFAKVGGHRPVRWAKVADGSQPTDLTPAELKKCLTE